MTRVITHKKKKHMAIVLALIMFISVCLPLAVRAITLGDANWNDPQVVDSWNEAKYSQDQKYKDGKAIPTGLAFNWITYNKKTGVEHTFPFNNAAYLSERPGYLNPDFAEFNNRYIYCVASHVQNYRLHPGAQAFYQDNWFVGKTDADNHLFPESELNKTNPEFNFLMLAIASNYPGASLDASNPSNIPYSLVNQVIAWLCTDEDRPGFIGGNLKDEAQNTANWERDFQYYKDSNVYKSLELSFPQDVAPEIYNFLHSAPDPNSEAVRTRGLTTMKDALFFDIWTVANFTYHLLPDWDKEIMTANAVAEEKDGEYHVYLDLFTNESAKLYLDGITFVPHGDWKYLGPDENGKQHFASATGELDDNGSIGHLTWPEEKNQLGALMPIDMTKAKLFSFVFYNDTADKPGINRMGNSQTYFCSVMEQGLDLYITIADAAEDSTGGGGSAGGEVERFKHSENFTATYNVNLIKYDAETGKPLADSHWDILEMFDASQLNSTDLDRSPNNPGSSGSGFGSLNSTEWGDDDISSNYSGDLGLVDVDANKYNWGNDKGSQFEEWDDPQDDACAKDDNATDKDGLLHQIDSAGNTTSTVAHTDRKNYTYTKGYCMGHPAPEIEYIECDHEPEEGQDEPDCDCEDLNQELHDEAWAQWYAGVQECETLVSEGGFFHCVEPGDAAKKALEEDRDQFYKDFISLVYDYSAEEIMAPKGYILHGTHTDDIPIEWRTVTSSEYKATNGATSINHSADSSNFSFRSPNRLNTLNNLKESSANRINIAYVDDSDIPQDLIDKWFVPSEKTEKLETKTEDLSDATPSTPSEPDDDDEISLEDDYDLFEDGMQFLDDDDSDEGTPSAPDRPDVESYRTTTGFVEEDAPKMGFFSRPGARAGGGSRNSTSFNSSSISKINAPDGTIVDYTFIVYNHRTEGEIHFNKRDFDLYDEANGYKAYGEDNGDGTLEGAVYGLFAAQDIIHPDTDGGPSQYDTGVVYKKDNLIAVATTDRDGNGSFVTITEAPGMIFDYDKGSIVPADGGWNTSAPKNLYMSKNAGDSKENDMERFEGYNENGSAIGVTDSESGNATYYKKLSSNQGLPDTWCDETTTGYMPIQNNEANNGNCWIGRPLIIGKDGSSYYIKELSRSEGYELSVYGKDDSLITNRDAYEAGGGAFSTGAATASVIGRDYNNGGNTFTVASEGTQNGYILKAVNIPEGATFNITSSEYVWDDSVTHKEQVTRTEPLMATEGEMVMVGNKTWPASIGDTVTHNGKTFMVNNVYTVEHGSQKVNPDNSMEIASPFLDITQADATSTAVMNEVNKLFLKTGFRNVETGAPWVCIEIPAFSVTDVVNAVNTTIFTNNYFKVFNAMQMLGAFESNGKLYVSIGYCYRDARTNQALYNAANDTVYVKTSVTYKAASGTDMSGFVYRTYDASACEQVERNTNNFVTSAIVPNQTAEGKPEYTKGDIATEITFVTRSNETFWAYAAGEYLLNSAGDIATKTITEMVDVAPTLVLKIKNEEVAYESYAEQKPGMGTYTIHIPQDLLDRTANGNLDFRITYNKETVKIDGVNRNPEQYATDFGILGITFPYGSSDSYIESIMLMYPGDDVVLSEAGTIAEPIGVFERPIRQKILVEKDIQTLPEAKTVWYCMNCGKENEDATVSCIFCSHMRTTEETKTIEYAHDTYNAVHSQNIDAGRENTFFGLSKDWLGEMSKGKSIGDSSDSIANFRFKAYLKSNLERLYRAEDGTIVWMDRNGNTMKPQMKDTNGDGNYDTFTWKYDTAYGGKSVDFPEKDKVSDGVLQSSNVQKIYTKVDHNTNSMTTSTRANNVWAGYSDPQTGSREHAGEITGFTTSERTVTTEGEAVRTNASLYSYDGVLVDRDRTDNLMDTVNKGYTRILETEQIKIENGTSLTEIQSYNYEKFFDAINAANADKWDDDMHTTYTGDSMKNYPGQKWFDTFYEEYQKDDADTDHTIANTDGADADGTAGGDKDTSFKPFRFLRALVFGNRADYEKYPAEENGTWTENKVNTSEFARANAEASDAVRQFAVKWYLEDEAAKLMVDNGLGENIAKAGGTIGYDEAVYDEALFHAIAKAYNYLRPFYYYDLDTIYSVEWDSAENGGTDKDYTTLSADHADGTGIYYNTSSYLPYGTYVVTELVPSRLDKDVNDWKNRHFSIERPKEVLVPSAYAGAESGHTSDDYDTHYNFDSDMALTEQAKEGNYLIRFGEELGANTSGQDEREFVIRAHSYHGDFEVYKYGLDIDKLTGSIDSGSGSYSYKGFNITQEAYDPLKDYYAEEHRGEEGVAEIGRENGGNAANSYKGHTGQANGHGDETANGSTYNATPLVKRYFYASVSEDTGIADDILFKNGATDDNNPSGMSWHDDVASETGELTAYDGKYSQALVPWTMTAPADKEVYSSDTFSGYADVKERNTFFVTKLKINKTDSETGEYILHDDAVFALYAASRYNTFDEIEDDAKLITNADEKAAFLLQFRPGDAKFYLKDTMITGSKEFLEAMGAEDIKQYQKRGGLTESQEVAGHLYTGLVKKGTPVCIESERIGLSDPFGDRTGQMTVWSTKADTMMANPATETTIEYGNQNVGYFKTSQPVGAGVYVLCELKAPDGYARSKPVAVEVYSDQTQYYVDGDMYAKVSALRYKGNLLDEYPYK